MTSLHGPQNLSHLPLHEMFSVVGYFVGNNEGAELCDQFRYQLKPKHEQIRKSKESEDARSEVRDGSESWEGLLATAIRAVWPAGPAGTGPLADQLFQKPVKTCEMRKKINGSKTQKV